MTHEAVPFTCDILVGREAECAAIRGRLEQRRPGVLLICGSAGIGKSRLTNDALRYAAELGHPAARGYCLETESGSPFAPLSDLLTSLQREAASTVFAGLSADQFATLAAICPGLGTRADAPTGGDGVQRKHALCAALGALFGQLPSSQESPLPVVAIEDLHWADPVTLDLLMLLSRRAPTLPLLLLLTFRDDEVGPELAHFLAELDRGRLATEVSLTGLDAAQVEAMVRAILKLQRALPADLLHLLASLTEGNPFFVEEVLKSLSASGQLQPSATGWSWNRSDALLVPRSVQDAVRRRVARLSPRARRVLEIAAVAGHRFDFDLLSDVTRLSVAELISAIRELIDAQIVVETGDDLFAFRHALSRQAVTAELLSRERTVLHKQIADALLAHPSAPVVDVAWHAFNAGMWEAARLAARSAGEQAMAMHAPQLAAEHFTRALVATDHLRLSPEPGLLRARGEARETLGVFDLARADFDAALTAARQIGDLREEVEALIALGLLWAGRDYAAAGEHLASALDGARRTGDAHLLGRALNRMGNWHLNQERHTEAIAHHEEALSVFERLGDDREVAATLDLIGISSFLGGDLVRGSPALERAVDLWRTLDDRRGLSSSLTLLSFSGPTFHTCSVPPALRGPDALAYAPEGRQIAREIGWRAGESWSLWGAGGLAAGAQGQYSRALPETREGLAIADEIDHVQWQAASLCMLGNVERDLFAWDRARDSLERAVQRSEQARSPYWRRSAIAWLALLEAETGNVEHAADLLQPEIATLGAEQTIAGRLVHLAAAEVALARGEAADALRIADLLLSNLPNGATHWRPPVLSLLRGRALLALERMEDAVGEFETGRHAARDTEALPLAWRLEQALAGGLDRLGRTQDAAAEWHSAWTLLHELAASIPDDSLRDGFLAEAGRRFPAKFAPPRPRATGPDDLTERERAVATLLTRGLTNREIAAELYISDWTAATHVRNILAKLGFASRSQIAAWAVENGIKRPR